MTVFPGEEHGLALAARRICGRGQPYRQQQNEGGNDLVFLNLQARALGLLDLESFKRQIRYCLLPNGTCTDMVLQVHGRYRDDTPLRLHGRAWASGSRTSRCRLVINECLLQSYDGTLRLFPNWPADRAPSSARCGRRRVSGQRRPRAWSRQMDRGA